MARKGKSARNKGNAFERQIVEFLKVLGYDAKTSRLVNRELDSLGVDIVTSAPFHIQCKAVEQGIPYHKILNDMPRDKTPVIFHKRNNKGTCVIMDLKDFEALLLFKKHKDIKL